MKKLFFLIAFFFITALSFAQNQVWVNGYTRSNGTYVQGHYRTAPNSTRNDNWTTVGNVNPHTGKSGTLPGDGYTKRRTSYASTYSSTPTYTTPTYSSSYSTPSYSTTTYTTPSYSSYSSTPTVYTGSRGGTYYINSNGNKTYVR